MPQRSGEASLLARVLRIGACGAVGLALAVVARAQSVLPRPDPPFNGKIAETYKDSQPDPIAVTKAPAGAPNVLIVLIDDVGYGAWSTFGGQIPTPNLDRLAKAGLRYTQFHTTALCAPTRAALLTGRNHHSAGTGVITEMGTGFPGYSLRSGPAVRRLQGERLLARPGSEAFEGYLETKSVWVDLGGR